MRDIIETTVTGMLVFISVGLILAMGTMLLPLILFYLIGKWYLESVL